MMLSQRRAVKERDCYSVSAAKLLALTPLCCSTGITLTLESQGKDYIFSGQKQHKLKVIGAQGKTESLTEFDLVAPCQRNGERMGEEGNVVGNSKLGKPGLESLFNSFHMSRSIETLF